MKAAGFSWLFALAMMMCLPASAQPAWIGPLTPAEPTTADRVSLTLTIGANYNECDLMMPGEVVVSRGGDAILVEYALRLRTEDDPPLPEGTVCFSTYARPFPVTADLGYLPAGDFDVSVLATVAGTLRSEPSVISFTVRASPTATGLAFIPANAPWALSLMLLVFGGLAARRLRAGA